MTSRTTPLRPLPEKPRVLVACKISALVSARQTLPPDELERFEELLLQKDPSVSRMVASDTRHNTSLELVCKELKRRGWHADIRPRDTITSVQGYDLVLTVGGDGTALDISHRILDRTPLLGINSDPVSSVGYFCASTADTFADTLDALLSSTLTALALTRFAVSINGEPIAHPVLNDVLIADSNPAATSRYILEVAGHSERQRSSGLWISTPAGSTAAIRSAGGIVLPLGSDLLQYLVREPCLPRTGRYNLLGGVLPVQDGMRIISLMTTGRIYLDGPHSAYDLQRGDRIDITNAAPQLIILGIDESVRFVPL